LFSSSPDSDFRRKSICIILSIASTILGVIYGRSVLSCEEIFGYKNEACLDQMFLSAYDFFMQISNWEVVDN